MRPARSAPLGESFEAAPVERSYTSGNRGPVPATIDELTVADDPAAWAALGFTVEEDRCRIGSVELRFLPRRPETPGQTGLLGWSLRGAADAELDGLARTISTRPLPPVAPAHPNGVLGIDHVVAVSPDLDRTVAALQGAGLELRRVREQPTPAGAPRQAFFRLGAEILEVVQEPDEVIARAGRGSARPAHFWGLALLAPDIDRTVQLLAPQAGEARPAVQPGRRIATLRRSAGLTIPVALITSPG
jgi:catechol 2,3-dioxygenase-like lactoylglutathione lyase family enzyme